MDFFRYQDSELHCEELPVEKLASELGTPCYIYSWGTIEMHYEKIRQAFAGVQPLICYSVKANSTLGILRGMSRLGAGFDVVSGGELYRVLKAGADVGKVVFSGPGKTEAEIRFALEQDILMFNVEGRTELELISRLAQGMSRCAQIALRVNPDVDPHTHRFVTTGRRENKFGMDLGTATEIVGNIDSYPGVRLVGLHAHIGSQITEVEPFVQTLEKLMAFRRRCADVGIPISCIDIGGGFGIHYRAGEARSADEFATRLVPIVRDTEVQLILEPGRFIVGNAGILVTRVLYVKPSGGNTFVIVDAGMNDLVRPSLYDAYHRIWPTTAAFPFEQASNENCTVYDVVGPVCESADFFAKRRPLPPLRQGDLLAIFSVGAYGASMSSNYNSRPRAAEALVSKGSYKIIRRRETYEDLLRVEM